MDAKAQQLTNDLNGALDAINAQTYTRIAPSCARVSTMTITARLNVDKVCRDSMAIAVSLMDGTGPLSSSKASRKRKPPSVFYNQFSCCHGTKSIKVFKNGRMHVTGCTSPVQFLEVASAVCTLMTEVAGISACDGSASVRVLDFDVHMINMNFGVGTPLYLQDLLTKCASRGFIASYDADTYPGLNVKMPINDRHVTALVFKSGKIIITGAKRVADIVQAHRMITSMLDGG